MATTWKSSLRDSIYNLYIPQTRTQNFKEHREEPKKKKKKKPQKQREKIKTQRETQAAHGARPVARCLGAAWVTRETQDAHRARPIARCLGRTT